jgi:pimeloyl-ACP methyl ester carboxylesterase
MPSYLITARKGQGKGFTSEPGPVQFLRLPETDAVYDKSHVVPVKTWVAEVRGLADGDLNPVSISPAGDVLIFVHGYNNDIAAVVDRTRALDRNLRASGWRGVVVGFDWPSANSVLNYIEDRRDAALVAGALVARGVRLLAEGQRAGCVTNVHLLGHSTGAYVILEAFAAAEKEGALFKSDWRVGQVALIGADIAADSLGAGAAWSAPLMRRAMRVTNYSNGADAVLAVSNAKRLGVSARAGRVGLPAGAQAKAVNVDCTGHFQALAPAPGAGMAWCHGWHFDDPRFGLDLALTLEGALDRHAIPGRVLGPRGLELGVEAARPAGMALWGIKA